MSPEATPIVSTLPEEGTRAVLRNRHFLLLWMAQALSQTAQNAIFFTLMVFVEERTGSTIHMGLLILSVILPSVFLGMAAGVFVDRWQKKTVLITTNLLRGVAVLGYLVFGETFALIYMVNFLFSTISQFFAPAELAAIPSLVPKKQLISANGLFNLTFTGSQLAGFVIVAPILVKWLGAEPLFVLIAVIYVFAAALVSFLPRMDAVKRTEETLWGESLFSGIRGELRDGWRLLRGDSAISLCMLHLTLTGTLTLIMGMLVPGYATRVLGIRADDAVYIFAPAGIGILLGITALPLLARRFAKERMVNAGLLVMSVSLLGLGVVGRWSQHLRQGLGVADFQYDNILSLTGMVMALALALGFTYAVIAVPAQTIIQERAPVDMRGRIFATQLVFANVASVLPLLFLGGLADLLGISLVIIVVGAAVLGIGVFSLYQARRLVPVVDD